MSVSRARVRIADGVLAACVLAGAIGIVGAPCARARAHDFTPGVLSLVERTPGRFEYAWTAPIDSGVAVAVTVAFPADCHERAGRWLECGSGGLEGEIVFRGLRDHRARVVVVLDTLDAPPRERLVGGDAPRVRLGRESGDTAGEAAGASFVAWLRVGIEHIALGFDHIAFLIGLLLVAGANRRALFTVTAFTIAHSLTLALAVLDVVRIAAAPVEAIIAASVVLVARESLLDRDTLARRAPWLVALVFGLVHGLGFAGALRESGLPEGSIAVPLVAFNVGVEIGQLVIVAAAMIAARVVARPPGWLRPSASYVIGALGATWMIARVAAIVMRAP